jgi:hypothetical protein
MSVLQAAFSSASTTSPCPLEAAKCSAVLAFCKDGGVSRQSGARMLNCCPYRESNTQIKEGGKNQGIWFTQTTYYNTNIMYIDIIFVLKAAHACNANRRKLTSVRPHTHKHTHTHTLTHTPHTSSLTEVCTSACTHTNTREKYVLKTENTSNTHTITSFRKTDLKLNSAS